MSSYRPLGPFPQFLLADGSVNAGGLITFYETDLTTKQDTWSDQSLSTLNSNPVVLDAAGRPTTDIWGSAAYGVVITDALGANPRTLNNVQPDSGTANQIPALVNGDFLTNDGSNLLWEPLLQVPDPTGFSSDILSTDGTLVFWTPMPTAAEPDISVTANSFRAGVSTNTSKFFVQMGSGSAPASGTPDTGVSITFPTTFTTCMHVSVMVDSTHTSQILVPYLQNPPATNGFSVTFSDAVQNNIVSSVGFTWIAFGYKTIS